MTRRSRVHTAPDLQKNIVYQKTTDLLAFFLLFALSVIRRIPELNRPPVHAASGSASSETKDEQDVQTLEARMTIRRELAGGHQHSYQIGLSADQFLNVAVRQEGTDVIVKVSRLGDTRLPDFDSERWIRGQESVSLVAETASEYRLVVSSEHKVAPARNYEKRMDEALRRVQLEMLKQGKRKHPYYWACFIQSGEWAKLK
jgi:CHAT domain-containing protein